MPFAAQAQVLTREPPRRKVIHDCRQQDDREHTADQSAYIATRHLRWRLESFALQRTQRAKLVAKPLAALTAGGPGYGSHMGSARRPRGRFLALEQAQAGFKLLEVVVTHVRRSDELLHETRHHTARYARASLVACEEAAPSHHRRQSPMQRLVRALALVRTVTEADRGHFRQDDVLCQHAGMLALVRKGSEAVL
jgi:hypothetical protein